MSDAIYCYPDTMVLKNKLNIKESYQLLDAEIDITSKRLRQLQKNPLPGRFNFKHLCDIHHYIFQDLYDWAGKPRTVNIGKGNLFCLPEHIQSYSEDVFRNFAKDCHAAKDDPAGFVHALAGHYGDMNALHPFREGNGRAQREFARELCLACGYAFDLRKTTHQEMLKASILSFDKGDNSGLERIFQKNVLPFAQYQHPYPQYLQILSNDDLPEEIPQHTKKPGHTASDGYLP